MTAKLDEAVQTQTSSTESDVTCITPGVYIPRSRNRYFTHCHRDSYRTKCARAVLKNGEINVEKFLNHKIRFFTNWFMSMVEGRWRWTLLNFFLAFTGNWLTFGFIYWCIAMSHGDLTEDHLPHNQNESNWTPCIENIYGFTSTFLFSVEVHTTVAYGKRSITLDCPDAISAMCLQCIISSIFQAFMVGILFAKLTRPKARTQTILFSRHAIVSLRDDRLCMIFRVGDMRKSRILNIKASMYLIRLNTDFHYLESNEQIELKTYMDSCESSFFLWPVSVIHVIDECSPLYEMSAADLLCGHLEIIAVFEGIIESTGQPVQARSSYSECDIIWGHRFAPMVSYDEDRTMYAVDFAKLSETEQVDTPLCSAKEYDEILTVVNSVALSDDCSLENQDAIR
ncbi:G protein-activated inward rectifier potassium channel 2-like isoform X2 [Ostrinia nubilalis]